MSGQGDPAKMRSAHTSAAETTAVARGRRVGRTAAKRSQRARPEITQAAEGLSTASQSTRARRSAVRMIAFSISRRKASPRERTSAASSACAQGQIRGNLIIAVPLPTTAATLAAVPSGCSSGGSVDRIQTERRWSSATACFGDMTDPMAQRSSNVARSS